MEVFVRLAEARGAVVSKSELLDTVWPDTIVGEDALTRAIGELRKALGDDARSPRFVETIPKRGYRLVCALKPVPTRSPVPSGRERASGRGMAVLVGASIGLVAVLVGVLLTRDSTAPGPPGAAAPRQTIWVFLAPVDDRTGTLVLAQSVQAALERELVRGERVALLAGSRVQQILSLMRRPGLPPLDASTAVELARRDGRPAAVLTGTVERTAGGYRLTGRLLDTAEGRVLRASVADARDEAGLLTAVGREGAAFAEVVEALPPTPGMVLPLVSTSSLPALDLFARAVREAGTVESSAAWPPSVTQLLEESLKADGHFGMARTWLAMALREAGRPERVYKAAAEQALAEIDSQTQPERLFTLGAAHQLLGSSDKSVAAFEALLASPDPPFEFWARRLLQAEYHDLGRTTEATREAIRLAEARPEDFMLNAQAAMAIVQHEDDLRRARLYVDRAHSAMPSAFTQRDGPCWAVAWLEYLPIYERWRAGRITEAADRLRAVDASIVQRVAIVRDAMVTTSGFFWLTLGRVADARSAFLKIGDLGQREWSLAEVSGVLGDREAAAEHLGRVTRAWDPVPFVRAGMFKRAEAIMRMPPVGAFGRGAPPAACTRRKGAGARRRPRRHRNAAGGRGGVPTAPEFRFLHGVRVACGSVAAGRQRRPGHAGTRGGRPGAARLRRCRPRGRTGSGRRHDSLPCTVSQVGRPTPTPSTGTLPPCSRSRTRSSWPRCGSRHNVRQHRRKAHQRPPRRERTRPALT